MKCLRGRPVIARMILQAVTAILDANDVKLLSVLKSEASRFGQGTRGEAMYWFSEGDLIGEVVRLRCEGQKPWFWYRDVLRQAEQRGFLRIIGHSDELPFWWRRFDDSVEVVSEKLREKIKEGGDINVR